MKVISIYPNFDKQGGAQDVVLQLAEKLNDAEAEFIVLTNTNFKDVHTRYQDRGAVFLSCSWTNIQKYSCYSDVIFLSHHRKSTTIVYFWLLLLGRANRLIHVAHNTFNTLGWLTFLPKKCIAVSREVQKNLCNYFGVSLDRIKVIYNGLPDNKETQRINCDSMGNIKILFPARVSSEKRQLELVQEAAHLIPHHVELHFAGVGPEYEVLQEKVKNYSNVKCLGFIDVPKSLMSYDYVMLFSKNEGLPLSLIEGLRAGKPLITNKLPVFYEINEHNKTGYMFSDFQDFVNGLRTLPHPLTSQYQIMSENARAKYEQLFTEESMIASYKAYLQRVEQCLK